MSAPEDDRSVTQLADAAFRLALAGDEAGAIRTYATALRKRVGRSMPAFMHLSVLRAKGKDALADRFERLALDLGADISFAGVRAEPDLSRGIAEYEQFLAAGRINARMVARYAQLLSLAGDGVGLERIMDPSRLLRVVQVDGGAPLGNDVAAYLSSDAPRATWHDTFRSTRQVHHIPHVDEIDHPALNRLFGAVRGEIDRYLTDIDAIDHPFFRWRPVETAFGAWGLISTGAGHNVPHIHPQGWLTGVYYAAWRGPIASEPVDQEGALHIAPDPAGDAACPGWAKAIVAPTPGTLVIMPSYYLHHTFPARPGSLRIALPFDVVDRRSFVTLAELDA
ncbi:MAG: putative 2OG-Fe(II) oxygenase [Phenylobacterium sp.]